MFSKGGEEEGKGRGGRFKQMRSFILQSSLYASEKKIMLFCS
jgi:hypothetical protein